MLIAVGAAAVGLLLLWIAGTLDAIKSNPGAQNVVNNLGSALITGMALVVLWELASKRSFAREVIEITGSATNLERSGIIRAGTEYLKDADWDNLFSRARELDIFFAYGQTWRNSNLSNLRAIAKKKDCQIRVFLPDAEDPETVKQFAARIMKTPERTVDLIVEAKEDFERLSMQGSANISIYYRPGTLLYSAYRFDNTAVVTLYSHHQERGSVPTIVCQGPGSLYSFVRNDLESIRQQSRKVFPLPKNEERDA
ncbi:hypothetical protein N8J89_09020 [Crossiella sp. CA-258035]|uniref:hypothetical protein n=1 Tax=Crossiella sp. CA-258035 TaxID=2981138 RepID=UPI0024BCD410|nr:hypothetical protein [Crossiella sp. CA-258035]WHT21181.1 hypothetical protein N8J89_09020 [Crossiella sp. CA-258035]